MENLKSYQVGQRITDSSVPALIISMGKSIAHAQFEMDATGVEIGEKLAGTKVELKDENGDTIRRSLLELGFTPTFYHFQEVTLEVKMTVSMEVSAGLEFGLGGGEDDDESEDKQDEGFRTLVPYGSALNFDVHGKFGFEHEGSSKITAKMVSTPAPSSFTEALRKHSIALSDDDNGDDN